MRCLDLKKQTKNQQNQKKQKTPTTTTRTTTKTPPKLKNNPPPKCNKTFQRQNTSKYRGLIVRNEEEAISVIQPVNNPLKV